MPATFTMNLVRRLLTLEAADCQDQEPVIGAAGRVCAKVCSLLSKTTGEESSQTLLARALILAAIQFPHLSAACIEANGSLTGLHRAAEADKQRPGDVTQQDAVEGVVALVAHLIDLLFLFVGEDLTLRLLQTVSPRLDLLPLDYSGASDAQKQEGRPGRV